MIDTIHATAVAVRGWAVLIEGPSGSGKSDLALRLIDRGAVLIADDRTELRRENGQLYACAPERIAGQLEVRGVGIVNLPYLKRAPVALAVRIGTPDRMPETGEERVIDGHRFAAMTVAALEASTPIKVERMLGLLAV